VKEPPQAKLVAKLQPLQAVIQKANKAIKRGDFENHGKTVAEVSNSSSSSSSSNNNGSGGGGGGGGSRSMT